MEDSRILVVERSPSNEKLSSFVYYFVIYWMENLKLLFQMWHVREYQYREKIAVREHNSILKGEIRKTKRNVYILVQTLKEMSENVPFEIK